MIHLGTGMTFFFTEYKIYHDVFWSASIKEYSSYGNKPANKANLKGT